MRALILAACLLLPIQAWALDTPTPVDPLDPHVQTVIYNPGHEVLVVSTVSRSLVIRFGPEEHVNRVVLETNSVDKSGKDQVAPWEGPSPDMMAQAPLGNALPLWAMRAGHSSAQVITTIGDSGDKRIYLLKLWALPQQAECDKADCDDPRIASGISFLYPNEARAKAQSAAVVSVADKRKLAAIERLKTDIFYGVRNWRYTAQGKPAAVQEIAPDEISDNSEVTAFRYFGNRPVPSFYIVDARGNERQITPIPQDDLLVVYESVPACLSKGCAHLLVRKGRSVVAFYNKGMDTVGVNPRTGTTSPNVVRVTRTVAK
jgi:type IV secretion system protein VirB9